MSNVTFPDETTGSDFTAAQVNEIKAAVNSKLDAVLGAPTYPLSRTQAVPLALSGGVAPTVYAKLDEILKLLISTLAQGDSVFWDLANFRFAPLALSPMDPNDFVLQATYNTKVLSYLGVKSLILEVFGPTVDVVVGDGAKRFFIPSDLNGMILNRVRFFGETAGTTGSSTFQVNAPGGDVLTTVATIAAGGVGPSTGQVIGTSFRAAATDAKWRIDVKTKTTTAMKGLTAVLEFIPVTP
jgi:hypothetical protein